MRWGIRKVAVMRVGGGKARWKGRCCQPVRSGRTRKVRNAQRAVAKVGWGVVR